MNEVWKPIKNYEDCYEVSNFGNVRSLNRKINYQNLKGKTLKLSRIKYDLQRK